MIQPEPLPPDHLCRHWYVSRRGAINIEIKDDSNVAEVSVREGKRLMIIHIHMHENDGIQTESASPPQTLEWKVIAETCFVPMRRGWKWERAFA